MKKLAKKAVDYGKKDSVWKRYRQMKKLEDEAYVLKENYTVDEKAVKALLEEKAVPLLQGPEDAYITRNEDGTLNIVDEKEGETIDEDGMVQNISVYLNEEWKREAFLLTAAESVRYLQLFIMRQFMPSWRLWSGILIPWRSIM